MEKKPSNKLLKFGIGGTIIAALCCFTPILVIVLSAVGLSAMLASLDIVLLPALFIFIGVTIYALLKRKQEDCCATNNSLEKGETDNDMKQESCCSLWSESEDFKSSTCPDNEKKGQSVDVETLRNLIKKERGHEIKDRGYYFCKAPDCDTVYFHPKSGQTFKKSDIKVRVGLKETDDPVWVCYCFDISKKMIAEEIENTGLSASGNRIRKEVADKNCECEIKNPSGRCCLGEVLAAEK